MTDRRQDPTRAEIELAIQRILSDDEFRTSRRRAELLRHLVRKALDGEGDRLKETAIAIDVFGRGAEFDPQMDSIVRGEARRLRQSLASYYVGAGAKDPFLISIPKGSYVPHFKARTVSEATGRGEMDNALPVAPANALSSPEEKITIGRHGGDSDPAVPATRAGRSRPALLVAALLACVLGIAGFVAVPGGRERAPMGMVTSSVPAVLVVPFEAAGPLEDVEALASGLSASLISDLMRFPGLRLYEYEPSLEQPELQDLAGPGKYKDADFLVRGVLLGSDDDISLAVRLTDVAAGQVVWSKTFTRPLTADAIVEIQADMSGMIASKLGEPHGPVRSSAMTHVGAKGAAMSSFSCVMQAHAYRHTNRAVDYPAVRACLESAVEQDPGYADAWAMLAILRLDGGRFGYDGATPEARNRALAAARAAAARALSLEPENIAATNALATIEHYSGRFEDSLEYSRRAVELNPNDPSTLGYHGWRLAARGQFEEGVPFLRKAIDRSANAPPVFYHMIAVERLMNGDMEGMLTAAERASIDQSSVSDALLAVAYGGLGLGDEAQAALDRMAQKWPLLMQDPAAAFGWHNLHPDLIEAIANGLETAGRAPAQSAAGLIAYPATQAN
jgi:TolB-like protein